MNGLSNLKIELFADGADLDGMIYMNAKDYIKGLTTNPTLMKKAGISDYTKFAMQVLEIINDKPISFEVFSDDVEEMLSQARKISLWGNNVFVKIPITNTKQHSTSNIVKILSSEGVKVNVTALMTLHQVQEINEVLNPEVPSNVSVFAGRIADTGRDPIHIMGQSLEILKDNRNCKLIWASPRELLNVFQADSIGCHIITATNDILKKLSLVGKDLKEYSLETVKMFHDDATAAGYTI